MLGLAQARTKSAHENYAEQSLPFVVRDAAAKLKGASKADAKTMLEVLVEQQERLEAHLQVYQASSSCDVQL
jgi:hypothetical protein